LIQVKPKRFRQRRDWQLPYHKVIIRSTRKGTRKWVPFLFAYWRNKTIGWESKARLENSSANCL